MGQKSTEYANDLLKHIFQNEPLPGIGDAGGLQPSSTPGVLYLSLHTADPGAGGSQDTAEAAYADYARVAVERSALGFTVVGNAVSPANVATFPEGGAGAGESCPYAAIGTDETGPGKILYRGALTPNITTGEGIAPEIKPTSMITES